MIKVSDLKKDFPIFEREINGKRLTYLDSGATSQKPSVVINEMSKANIVYFSGGNPQHLINSISAKNFMNELIRIKKIGILAGCSAGAMIMGEKMIKGTGLNFIKNSIIIPHYGESYYSWISNTVKLLNKGKYKLICLEKDTYFTITESNIKIIGDNNIHIIYKNDQTTYSDGDILDLSILEL